MINLPWPTDEHAQQQQQQQRAETLVHEQARQGSITALQQRMHAEAAAASSTLSHTQAHLRASAALVLQEIEKTFPALRDAAYQARDALMGAQAAYDAAHRQAQQHATTPPESQDAIDAWVEQGGALDRRVVGLGHLLKQADETYQRTQAALGQAVEQRIQQQRLSAMRESNTRRRALMADVQQRQAELQAFAQCELAALAQFEADHLAPLDQVVYEGLIRGLQTPERDMNGLFKID